MMKGMMITACVLLLASSGASALQLKKGETACRHEKALAELDEARTSGDDRTVEWLFNGAACIVVPEDTQVQVVEHTESGYQQLRTTERRRNLTLWAAPSATQTTAE